VEKQLFFNSGLTDQHQTNELRNLVQPTSRFRSLRRLSAPHSLHFEYHPTCSSADPSLEFLYHFLLLYKRNNLNIGHLPTHRVQTEPLWRSGNVSPL
jgi:hypothetical protein